MPEREDKTDIQKTGGTPSPAPVPTGPESPAAAAPAAGTFGGLRAFPSNPFQKTELPPPKSAVAELVGGALAGAVIGGLLGGAGGAVLVGVPVGILDGYLVSRIADRAGRLTARAVLINLVRIPFMTLALFLFPFTFAYGIAREEYEER